MVQLTAATIQLDNYTYTNQGHAVGKLNIKVDGRPDIAMCLNFLQNVSLGTSWQADVLLVSNLDIKYTRAAWLFEESLKLNNPTTIGAIQRAAWYMIGATPALDNSSQVWYNLALNQSFTVNYSKQFVVYRPSGTYGQEFIAVVPEPNTMLLVTAVGMFFLIINPRKRTL
jgi:hypothetical protein